MNQTIGIDELLAERALMDQEIRRRAQTELTALEQRKTQLLAIAGPAMADEATSEKKRRAGGTPKYRNPANPDETWTGRGKKPGWMADWIASGKDPNDLLIGELAA